MPINPKVCDFPLILLSAGASTRMGTAKGLLTVGGSFFLMWQLERFRIAGGSRALVILGAGIEEFLTRVPYLDAALEREVSRPDFCGGLGVRVLENTVWQRGPFSSLLKGIETYREDGYRPHAGAFISPIDTPLPRAAVWRGLASQLISTAEVVKPVYQGRGGHPVLLSDSFLKSLLATKVPCAETRLDLLMRLLPAEAVRRVAVTDPRVTLNLNSPEVYQKWLEGIGNQS